MKVASTAVESSSGHRGEEVRLAAAFSALVVGGVVEGLLLILLAGPSNRPWQGGLATSPWRIAPAIVVSAAVAATVYTALKDGRRSGGPAWLRRLLWWLTGTLLVLSVSTGGLFGVYELQKQQRRDPSRCPPPVRENLEIHVFLGGWGEPDRCGYFDKRTGLLVYEGPLAAG